MALNSIEQEWEGFAAMVFRGTKPSATQSAEMKKAFFAGVWSLMCALEEIGQPHVSEEAAERYLQERRRECLAFKRALLQEYSQRN